MHWNTLSKYQDIGLLVLRLGFGLGFLFFHGWGKLTGGPEVWADVGGVMTIFGIGFGHAFFGFMAAFAESIGGLMFAAGLLFRPISSLLAFVMFTAMLNHFISGQGTPAHAFKNLFVLLGIMTVGPGKYSLDSVIASKCSTSADD